ncbi:MAG: response regulator [Deltaproteobacteria bacterium]|nr:response regulator [Deltaproteobacteria bacterium]
MALRYKHKLLLVDDEESITKALQRLFRKEGYEIHTALSGQEGLEVLKEAKKSFSLIISDQRMPGMTGAQFLEKAKNIFPNAKRILLTGYSDIDAIVDAINKGEIHRYLAKPWNDDDLLIQTRQILEQMELEERNQKLESSVLNAIRLLSSLVEILNPKLGEHMKQVAPLAREIAEEYALEKEQLDQIEIAGMLHDIGLLGAPERILEKDPDEMSETERYMFNQHPEIGQICLQTVESLDQVGAIVLAHHEHYDGSGFPNGLIGDEIPLGARIISVVADYCQLARTWPTDVNEIMTKARKYIGPSVKDILVAGRKELINDITSKILLLRATQKYDPDVVMKLVKNLEPDEEERKRQQRLRDVVAVHFNDLREGMVLGKNLRTVDGRLVLTRGTTLNQSLIPSIQRLGEGNVLEGSVYIINSTIKEPNGKQMSNKES